jgi:adenosylcobyric acid synthase
VTLQWMVLGTGPASAKTCISLGLGRLLAESGVLVAPFKAIATLTLEEQRAGFDAAHMAAPGVFHHAGACRVDREPDMNPVVVVEIQPGLGELHLKGEPVARVEMLNRDAVRTDLLPAGVAERVTAAIDAAYASLKSRYRALVIEGAGSPLELAPQDDWANHRVARLSQAPSVLVARFSNGGSAAGLVGTLAGLAPDLAQRVVGFVLSDVTQPDHAGHTRHLVERLTGLKSLGAIPAVRHGIAASGPGTDYEPVYSAWARALSASLDLAALGAPFPSQRAGSP